MDRKEFIKYIKIQRDIKQGCVFSPDLFNFYNEAIMRELDVLPGFIIVSHNLKIRYADDTVVIADTEKKLQELLQKEIKENEKKGLNIKRYNIWLLAKERAQHVNYKLKIPKSSKYKNLNI